MSILNRVRYLLAGPGRRKTLLFKGCGGLQRSGCGFLWQHGLTEMQSIKHKARSRFSGTRLAASTIAALLSAFLLVKCDPIEESIRRWGEESRRDRAQALQEGDLQRWQNDLQISRAEAEKLNEEIHELVQESELQGRLSWRIARAYMNRGRYDLAGQHFQAAIENERLNEDQVSLTDFERALPYFEEAIKRNPLDPDLLFDAGLCYANASRAAGWELNRFETAVLLFETVERLEPTITRSRYQLALLYGKAENPEVRDLDRSVALLQEIIRIKEDDIPAHFALGHMLVARAERGDLESARTVYADIIEILENLDRAGSLRGGRASGCHADQTFFDDIEDNQVAGRKSHIRPTLISWFPHTSQRLSVRLRPHRRRLTIGNCHASLRLSGTRATRPCCVTFSIHHRSCFIGGRFRGPGKHAFRLWELAAHMH